MHKQGVLDKFCYELTTVKQSDDKKYKLIIWTSCNTRSLFWYGKFRWNSFRNVGDVQNLAFPAPNLNRYGARSLLELDEHNNIKFFVVGHAPYLSHKMNDDNTGDFSIVCLILDQIVCVASNGMPPNSELNFRLKLFAVNGICISCRASLADASIDFEPGIQLFI